MNVQDFSRSLAMMLGVSRPTLNKELQALPKLGAISLHYGYVEISDMRLLIGGGNPLEVGRKYRNTGRANVRCGSILLKKSKIEGL